MKSSAVEVKIIEARVHVRGVACIIRVCVFVDIRDKVHFFSEVRYFTVVSVSHFWQKSRVPTSMYMYIYSVGDSCTFCLLLSVLPSVWPSESSRWLAFE